VHIQVEEDLDEDEEEQEEKDEREEEKEEQEQEEREGGSLQEGRQGLGGGSAAQGASDEDRRAVQKSGSSFRGLTLPTCAK
jgi:hypothetical protein